MTRVYQVKRWTLEFSSTRESLLGFVADDVAIDWQAEMSNRDFLDLYRRVGEKWNWFDRCLLPDAELKSKLADPFRRVGRLTSEKHGVVGFTEAYLHSNSEIEIAYFGLFPEQTGHGLGKPLFAAAVLNALDSLDAEAAKVWLTTCAWDSSVALPFYQRMGFEITRQDFVSQQVPADFDAPREN